MNKKPKPEAGPNGQKAETDNAISSCLAEYEALRSEMEWLISGGNQYQHFAFALLAIAIPALAWLMENAPQLIVPFLLLLPFMYCLLGFLYSRQHEEVFIVAAYLRDEVRPKIRSLSGDNNVWGWEEYKWSRLGSSSAKHLMSGILSGKLVHVLRMLLFTIPSVVSLVVLYERLLSTWLLSVVSEGIVLVAVYATILLFDTLLFLAFLLYVITQSDFAKRFGLTKA